MFYEIVTFQNSDQWLLSCNMITGAARARLEVIMQCSNLITPSDSANATPPIIAKLLVKLQYEQWISDYAVA